MRFIVDSMLGKLARWLRLMGYDVKYSIKFTDGEIIAGAKNRIILTRDRGLLESAKSRGCSVFLIRDMDIKGQLLQLKEEKEIELRAAPELARCPMCNGEIESTGREKLEERVPENVNDFWICKSCKNVYWEGGHWKNIKDTIKDIENRVKDV